MTVTWVKCFPAIITMSYQLLQWHPLPCIIVNDVRIITLFELTGSKWRQMDVMLFLQNRQNFDFFKVLKIIVGEYFDSYSLMFFKFRRICKNKSWKKLKIGQLCIWKLYTYNTVYYTQGNIYSRFIFTQFSLENIGICKQKNGFIQSHLTHLKTAISYAMK